MSPAKPSKQMKGGLATKAGADAYAVSIRDIMEAAWELSVGNLAETARRLNTHGVPTPRGGDWHAQSVARLIRRIEQLEGRPLIPKRRLNAARQKILDASAEELLNAALDPDEHQVDSNARRMSRNGRFLRSFNDLAAARKPRKARQRRDRRGWRRTHGERLRVRLLELYPKHTAAKYIARELNAAGFPAPPGTRGGWSITSVLREGRRCGAPWPRQYTKEEWKAWFTKKRSDAEDRAFRDAYKRAERLRAEGRHREADAVEWEGLKYSEYFDKRGRRVGHPRFRPYD